MGCVGEADQGRGVAERGDEQRLHVLRGTVALVWCDRYRIFGSISMIRSVTKDF